MLFFLFVPFVSAFFANYVVNISSASFVLDSLESTTTPFSISLDPKYIPYFDYAVGGARYKISRYHDCSQYDDDYNCMDKVDLCPYISLEPKNEEPTEIGFSQSADDYYIKALGEINGATDVSDAWEVKITSPCFEGECPADYDSAINGEPLSPSLKGQTFTCNLSVNSVDPPVFVKKIINQNIAYAVIQNKISISTVLTGKYTPPGPPPCTVDCFSNILFLPGLEASRLYMQKNVLGITVEDQLWEPNANSDVEDLYLDSNGVSINNVYTKDIIGTTNVAPKPLAEDIYKNLILKLNGLVSLWKINNWEAYAYDWRKGVDDIGQNGTSYEKDQIFTLIGTLQSLANSSKTGRVTIIAHSNGGLLAKYLIKKLVDDNNAVLNKIDRLILVASPQLGTPDGLFAILHGYDQKLPYRLMSEVTARQLAKNMPSAYGLLPSKKYFDQTGISPLAFFASTSAQKYQTNYGSDINNYQEEKNFVLGQEGRTEPAVSDLISPIKGNSALLNQAEILHDSIDNMVIPSSIKVIQIAGWGKSTITGMTYTDSDIQPITSIRGDKTVFMPSALYGQGTKYWLDLSDSTLDHKNILEDPQLLDFIESVIKQEPLSFPKISYSEPLQIGNRLHLSAHSPVTLGATDTLGNFTGKVCDENNNCYIQENIPGSTYQEFGEGKYVTLAEDKLQKVTMQGTDIGTFTFNFEKVAPDQTSQTQYFIDIPVTTQTQAEITVNSAGAPQLALDVTGDGKTDITITPNDAFDPISYLQIMKVTIDSLGVTQAKKNAFDRRVDNIIKSIQKGKVNKALLKADKFKTVLENKLAKSDPNKPKPKRLSKTDAQLLLDILNKLLDNLETK